jgi:NAD(P)-dependent dehydrogenase (short-subunit alcohol dehydrogenase family)
VAAAEQAVLDYVAPRTTRLAGQVAVITGGAGGVGRNTARLMANAGVDGLVLADMDLEGAEQTVALLQDEFGFTNAVACQTDVSSDAACKAMIDLTEKRFGKLTVLFNNAGIMHGEDDNAVATEERIWDLTFNINVKGVFFGCKHGIPALQRAGGGSIINTASFVALRGAATPQLAYTSSKGAVLAMSRELAVLHAKENIRVNALCPGPLHTKLLMDFFGDNEEAKQRRLVHLPTGRFGQSDEIGHAVVFLASPEASYVTGTDFLVDGGLAAAYTTAL